MSDDGSMRIRELNTHPAMYLTVRQLAQHWQVSPSRVYKLINTGELPAVRMGPRSHRISTAAALDYERRMATRNDRGDDPECSAGRRRPS